MVFGKLGKIKKKDKKYSVNKHHNNQNNPQNNPRNDNQNNNMKSHAKKHHKAKLFEDLSVGQNTLTTKNNNNFARMFFQNTTQKLKYNHSYSISPSNFLVLSVERQKRKLSDFFELLKMLENTATITLERVPIMVSYGSDGDNVNETIQKKMEITRVMLDSIDPLDDTLERLGFNYTIDEPHQQIKVQKEYMRDYTCTINGTKLYGRNYTIYGAPTILPPAWIHHVFSTFHRIQIHITPIRPDVALRKMQHRELLYSGIKSTKADVQKKMKDILAIKQELELGNTSTFTFIITASIFALSKKELYDLHKTVRRNCNAMNIRYTTSFGIQSDLCNGDGASWLGGIESLHILYPFSSADMLEAPNGIPLGMNRDTRGPVIYDVNLRKNHNIFTAGTTGSGKSFTNKIILKRFLEKRPNTMCIIIDPQGEYIEHASYFGLDAIEIKPGNRYGLDPFVLFDTKVEAADLVGVATSAPNHVRREWRAICDNVSTITQLYEKSSQEAKKYMRDLVEGSISKVFLPPCECNDSSGGNDTSHNDTSHNNTSHNENSGNGCTENISQFSDHIIISLKHTDGQEYEGLLILLVLAYAWQRVNLLPAKQWKFILLDEAWRMTKLKQSIKKIGDIARQGRKRSLIFALSTQQFGDLDRALDDSDSKLTELFDTKIIMQMSQSAALATGKALDLTDSEIELVTNFRAGNGLLQTSDNAIYLKFEATEQETKYYFNTKAEKE